jgi:hypothetical protein
LLALSAALLPGLVIAALLLLTGFLTAALLAGLIALLLLARLLVGILILVLAHSVYLQRCWFVWIEVDLATLQPIK